MRETLTGARRQDARSRSPRIRRRRTASSPSYRRNGVAASLVASRRTATGTVDTTDRIGVFRPIVLNGERIGTIHLESDRSQQRDARPPFRRASSLLVLAGSTVIAFAVAWMLQGFISGPILRLAAAARTVTTEKSYTIRVVRDSKDEVGTLVDGFNEMLGEIHKRDEELQRPSVAPRGRGRSADVRSS